MSDKKPCLVCGNPCEVLQVQIGDLFNRVYLRLCDWECFAHFTYEFIYDNLMQFKYKRFLEENEHPDDHKECQKYIKQVADESLEMFRDILEKNKELFKDET